MYFPYLFGQSSELLALRNANLSYLSSGLIVPIIEPIRSDPSRLLKCLEILGQANRKVIVILNPSQGDFYSGVPESWSSAIGGLLSQFSSIIPALICQEGVKHSYAKSFIDYFDGREVAIIYRNSNFSNDEMRDLAISNNVKFHIVIQNTVSTFQVNFFPTLKIVHIHDRFKKKLRNADYYGMEYFTDDYKNFYGRFAGFGDYTVVGSELQNGGGPPGAVAIHITFRNLKTNDLWIQHFVSDEVDRDVGSPASKFLEAVGKLIVEYQNRSVEFGMNPALMDYFNDFSISHFPGLAKNKERQICHHIARVHDILAGLG